MEDGETTGTVSYACVTDEAFLRLWKAANERALTREEFCALPMPRGARAEDVWNAVCALREWSGRDIGFNENRMLRFWVNLSEGGKALVRSVVERSGEASIIGRYVACVGFRRAFVEEQVDSVRTALSLDGMPMDYESARAVLLGEAASRTPAERLVANYERILAQELATRAGSAEQARNARALYAELARSVTDLTDVRWNMVVLANLDACLAGVARATDETAFCAARYFWGAGHDIFFASRLQATFSSLLRKVYFIRSGHENLALLPLSAHFSSEGAPAADAKSCDISASVEKMLTVISQLLGEMERIATERLGRIEDVRAAVAASPAFNLRQKDVLAQAMADPQATFDYDSLAQRFQASYNTVRSDMGRLVSAGLLRSSLDGHRTVLRPAPDIMGALERMTLA